MTIFIRDGIMFICESKGSFDIACRMIRRFDFKAPLYLYASNKILESSDQSYLQLFDHYTSNFLTIPGILKHIKLVFLGAHESTPHCKISNAVGYIAKKTHTSVVSIQHGWIQPGLNFNTKIKNIDYTGVNTDNSRSLYHFSSILNFFGENGIGYPAPNHKKNKEKAVETGNNRIIIATNFNWGVYTENEFEEFSQAITMMCKYLPNSSIYHRPHPAERNATKSRLLHDDTGRPILNFHENPLACELDWPTVVITTPSTVALDYITTGIKTLIYTPKIFTSYIEELNLHASSFENGEEMLELLDANHKFSSSKIPLFPSSNFSDLIESLLLSTKDFVLSEEDFIKYCTFVA
nr:hypothetical protein [uncultured Pseudomonas sp.]